MADSYRIDQVEIAADSEGASYSGDAVKSFRRRVKRIRSLLQAKGTKSAKRHLRMGAVFLTVRLTGHIAVL